MWYDLDKAAEGIMRSADLAIKAAEQSATEPPWDGFCGLVRVCDDADLKERGIIRAVACVQPTACNNSAAATSPNNAECALQNWIQAPGIPLDQPQQVLQDQVCNQRPCTASEQGGLTPWQEQDLSGPAEAIHQQQHNHLNHTSQQQQQHEPKQEHQQQLSHPASHSCADQSLAAAQTSCSSTDPATASAATTAPAVTRAPLWASSFNCRSSSDDEFGDALGTAGDLDLGCLASCAADNPPEWLAACLLGSPVGAADSSTCADIGGTPLSTQADPGGQTEHQGDKQQTENTQQQQQLELDRLLADVFAAAEQEVHAEEAAAAAAAGVQPQQSAASDDSMDETADAHGTCPEGPVTAAVHAVEQQLPQSADAAADTCIAGHLQHVNGLLDRLSSSPVHPDTSEACTAAVTSCEAHMPQLQTETEALLAAADEEAVLAAKYEAPGIQTPHSSAATAAGAACAAGAAAATAASALDDGACGGSTSHLGAAAHATDAAAPAQPACGVTASTDALDRGSNMDMGCDADDVQDEVGALLAATAEAVALEAKHAAVAAGWAHSTLSAADVEARVSALGVTSAAGLQAGTSGGDMAGSQVSEEGDTDSDGCSSSGSSDGSSGGSSDGSSEPGWLDDLPSAPQR